MQEILTKRLLLFGRMILVVWLLAAAAWLQKLDSIDLRDDVNDLTVLASIEQVPSADQLRGLPVPTS